MGICLAAAAPVAFALGKEDKASADTPAAGQAAAPAGSRSDAKVAIMSCKGYGPEVRAALEKSFDLLGGIGGLVKNQTVTVKINLTGSDFHPVFSRPVGESFMTHSSTAMALGSLLFAAGAKRVRFVESTNRLEPLEKVLGFAGWDVNALLALGNVELEDTRNLGKTKKYAPLQVASGGYLFSSFELNHAYHDTDVLVSLSKLKTHTIAGVTMSMKNLFGITPNALYGDQAGSENATTGRGKLHDMVGWDAAAAAKIVFPGARPGTFSNDPGYRVPRIVADLCEARPIHLCVIDGITSMSGGEGPWSAEARPIGLTTPGVLIVGKNPVSTDAVGTAVMGFDNPRAARGEGPFKLGDNHLVLAEQRKLGIADLSKIEVLGVPIAQARYPYPL